MHLFHINRHYRRLLLKALLLGMMVSLAGILLATSSVGRWLEEEVALSWLFKLRGLRSAPPEVVVISIDRASSEQLGLPNKPRKWPRSLHADLLRKLAEQGAAMIAFDIIFEEQRNPADNRLFAQAINDAGNVLLFQYLKKEPVTSISPAGVVKNLAIIETLIPPLPVLEKAAFGLAPFPLPKVPAKVNHFILFKPELGNVASLPVLALQVYGLSVYEQLLGLLKTTIPDQLLRLPVSFKQIQQQASVQHLASELRQLFLQNPDLDKRLMTGIDKLNQVDRQMQDKTLRALIAAYANPPSMYLNFYGPPQTITTIPYYKILQATKEDGIDLKGKAVFVGFAEQFQPDQKDAFYTVYTEEQSGLDISGVEIAATAFANLLDNSVLTVPEAWLDMLILVLWSLLLGLALRLLPGLILVPATVALGLVYVVISYTLFDQHNYWIPLAIPLAWQAPLCVMAALLWGFTDAQRERRNIRQAFGYHLPVKVVDQLARGVDHITATGQHVHGIVLATDAEQYTALSEQLEPAQLHDLMNRYYETLFLPIRQAGGVISDVVGDAALAIWASSQPDARQRQQACQAALDILYAIEKLNRDNAAHALPTRLGLHFGEVVMGHVGAVDHYEYRAVGDIVNTATRIEGLNKQLGTRIIVSQQVLEGVEGFITRELGRFLLKGKHKPLTLYELVGKQNDKAAHINYELFQNALHAFQTQNWIDASKDFRQFMRQYGADGPSQYYLALMQQQVDLFQDDWDGVIKLTQK